MVRDLAANCVGANLTVSTRSSKGAIDDKDVNMDVIHLSKGTSRGKAKAMIMFGEHARELITVESGLHLLRTLCGQGDFEKSASQALDMMSFVIVPNANPSGRVEVDKGKLCKRTNGNGVDLNRNWGELHRDGSLAGTDDETAPGPSGFSEAESQMLRDIVHAEKPDLFLSVHSGSFLMSMPYGYTPGVRPKNADAMAEVLESVSATHTMGECPHGPLAEVIGYESHACDIDYASEVVGVPYSFNWEIYTDRSHLVAFREVARCRSGARERGNSAHHCALKRLRWSSTKPRLSPLRWRQMLTQVSQEAGAAGDIPDNLCKVSNFNPVSEEETRSVLNQWTPAYLELVQVVARRVRRGGGADASGGEA